MSKTSIPGIQRHRAAMALTVLKTVLDGYRPLMGEDAPFAEQLRKVQRWHDVCFGSLALCPSLSDARSIAEKQLRALAPYIQTRKMSGEERANRYAALWTCAATMVNDVYATCATYAPLREWRYLRMTAWTMLEKFLLPLSPGADEEGTKIYEAVA